MLTIDFNAFDSLEAGMVSRRLYIDAEPVAGVWSVVVRGEDMAVVGRSLMRRPPALVFNRLDGSYETYVVAHGTRAEAEQTAESLRSLYRSTDPIGQRLARLPVGTAPLALLLVSRFTPERFGRDGKAWRCRAFAATRAASRAAQCAA